MSENPISTDFNQVQACNIDTDCPAEFSCLEMSCVANVATSGTMINLGGVEQTNLLDYALDMQVGVSQGCQGQECLFDLGVTECAGTDCSTMNEPDQEIEPSLDIGFGNMGGVMNQYLDAEVPLCVSEAQLECFNGDIYWFDSCGSRGDQHTACPQGAECIDEGTPRCVCTEEVTSSCVDNARYWYNSCGEQGEIRQQCTSSQVCEEDTCMELVSGFGSCGDPLEIRGSYNVTVNSCDTYDHLSFCGSFGVNDVAVRVVTNRPCSVNIFAENASFHFTEGDCSPSSSCIGGFENFQRNIDRNTLFIVEPADCGNVRFDVYCP